MERKQSDRHKQTNKQTQSSSKCTATHTEAWCTQQAAVPKQVNIAGCLLEKQKLKTDKHLTGTGWVEGKFNKLPLISIQRKFQMTFLKTKPNVELDSKEKS